MRKITIIPARSGSKGLKNKNILDLGGIPMFAWSIIHAKFYSKDNDQIIVSSDSQKYLEIAEKYGAIPHLRSKNLAEDETKTEPVMKDVTDQYAPDENDLIVLLQPTSPIRKKETINKIFKCFKNKNVDSALTITKFHSFIWDKGREFVTPQSNDRPRRQEINGSYLETGSIYATRYELFNKNNNRVSGNIKGIEVSFEEFLEVDTKEEFNIVESYMNTCLKEWDNLIP
jgi:CMP-N,N'-diacetyllegionaminic acid synthase|tara:strand:+ start:3454 stop:4140 length:687 start_codon:yes stop_codon:yes gene_type:complete